MYNVTRLQHQKCHIHSNLFNLFNNHQISLQTFLQKKAKNTKNTTSLRQLKMVHISIPPRIERVGNTLDPIF